MDRDTIMNQILSFNGNVDFSEIEENTTDIESYLESPRFENELKAFVKRYKQLHHKNIVPLIPNDDELDFLNCLPYLCFIHQEKLKKNAYLFDILQNGMLSSFFIPVDELKQRILELKNCRSFIVCLPMLAIQVITTIKWHFMNELMTEMGLGRKISRFEQTTTEKKEITTVIKPMNKMMKSFNDNMRLINMKLAKGESIVGDIQLGWFRVSDELRGFAKQPNAKEFILEDIITNSGKLVQGLIPDELKQLTILVREKPNRSDTRKLYDQLFLFYQKMNPLDGKFESLGKRLEGLGKDAALEAKETSLYYELLGRKMRRYFGIEFVELA